MIITHHVTKSILDKTLFTNVSFVIHPREKVGLIGTNGAGKSTLLKIILDLESADSGTVDVGGERLGYLSQSPEYPADTSVRELLLLDKDAKNNRFLQQVGLSNINPSLTFGQLSGGQKTRIALAKVLQDHPTALLLDEPTNHLDLDAIQWFERWLKGFPGSVLLVSHDRRLLQTAVDRIFEMDPANQTFHEYQGGYAEYLEQKLNEKELQEESYRVQQNKKNKMETWLADKRQQASVHPNPATGRLIRAMERRLQREVYDQTILKPRDASVVRGLKLDSAFPAGKRMVRCKDVQVMVGPRTLLTNTSFDIFGSDRVLLSGENGSGKTTLLRLIIGDIQPSSGSAQLGEDVTVGYFAQEHENLNLNKTVLEEFTSTERLHLSDDPRNVLGSFLFSGNTVFKKIGDLSMGERVRLMFLKLTHQNNTFLILDEPTNHLDIPSREVVERALHDYRGAFIVVSHDRYFLDAIGITRELKIENRKITERT